ncbi:MAG: S-layer homology domain-containing protein [Candidatus Saccharicenans sp.]|nr:S-layer homology domain-containing protein [Candidatus Saccharicenans sp.]MDH7575932.1 S-layer homology domain-containing protein [Candidatus Saccharicenans sp.]
MKKIIIMAALAGLILFLNACISLPLKTEYVPPAFHLENPQPVVLAQLSLNERLAFEEGWKSLKQGNIDRARKEFAKLDRQNAFFNLGEGYCRLYEQQLSDSEAFFLKALELNADLISARVGLAIIYEQLNNQEKEFLQLREILKKAPDHNWAKPRYEDLRSRMTEALMAEARNWLNQKRPDQAREALLKALFYSPELTEAHLQLARLYRNEKKLAQALTHYQALYNLLPRDKQVLKEYAETLEANDDLSKSLDIYERLRELAPGDKQIQDKVEYLKNSLGIIELPSMYNEIAGSQAITRQDLAAILAVKFNQFLPQPSAPPIIVDISTSWAARFIIRVVATKLMDKYDNHTFEPTRQITRAELADAFSRLISYLKGKGKKLVPIVPPERVQINDIPADNYYYQPAVNMIAYQLMELGGQKRFNPDQPVSGIEALRIADILLNLVK